MDHDSWFTLDRPLGPPPWTVTLDRHLGPSPWTVNGPAPNSLICSGGFLESNFGSSYSEITSRK